MSFLKDYNNDWRIQTGIDRNNNYIKNINYNLKKKEKKNSAKIVDYILALYPSINYYTDNKINCYQQVRPKSSSNKKKIVKD